MIYIDRTIIILNNQATIEQPIVLYKGDKNVQLLFTLKDNPLKYKSMENAYGQLIIKRKASPIFSEVARLSSNKVTFVVTEEMIDELNEVGEYEFQIRLFSQDKTSRATLPPVANGIVIREPILEEEVPNEVGVATVNEVEVVAEDTELEVFDENGDYIKTEWKHKDIITDVKLNKIEEAIYEINEKEVDLTDYALKKDVPSIEGLATETYVQEQIAQAELGGEENEVDLSIYATKENPTFTGTFSLNRKANSTVGDKSVALGSNVVASGMNSTAIGLMSQATGLVSTAIGSGNKASGSSSMALGMGTIATGDYQLVHGRNNIEDTEDKYLHIVGNGQTGEPSNAYTLDFDGNAWYGGKITIEVEPTEDKDVATKKYVDSKQGTYVTKTELTETLGVYVTEEELEGKGFATETYVTNAIANAQLNGEEVDLSGYATKDDLNAKADKEHTHSQYLTEHQDISGKVDKVEGKSLVLNTEIERLATLENYNDTEIRGLIEGKADENHTHEGYLTEHQDISHLATKEELFSGSYNDLTNKPTIPSIEGLATTDYVDEQIANIDIPTVEDTIVTVTATTLTTDKYQYTTISGDTEIALPTTNDTFKEIHLFFNLSSDFANTITLYSTNQIRYQQELEFEGGNAYELVCTFVPNMYWLVGLVKYEGEVNSASGGGTKPPTVLE